MGLVWALPLIAVLVTVYAFGAARLARRYRLSEPDADRLLIELPTAGHHIALFHYPPADLRYAQPVVLCHGLASNRFNFDFHDDGSGSDRLSLARRLARLGFDVWSLETRGHGHASVPSRARWSFIDELREDVVEALRTVHDMTDAREVFWVGHSWGGLLGLNHALRETRGRVRGLPQIRGIVAVGTPGDTPKIFRWIRPLAEIAARGWVPSIPTILIARLALPWVGVLSWFARGVSPQLAALPGPLMRRLLASLPSDVPSSILADIARWGLRGEVIDEHGEPVHYGRIRQPVLMIGGLRDLLAPIEGMRRAFDDLGSRDKRLIVAEAPPRAGRPVAFGHGGLLLGDGAPEAVYTEVERWLEDRAQPVPRPEIEHPGPLN